MKKLLIISILMVLATAGYAFQFGSYGGGGKRINATISNWTARGVWTGEDTYEFGTMACYMSNACENCQRALDCPAQKWIWP